MIIRNINILLVLLLVVTELPAQVPDSLLQKYAYPSQDSIPTLSIENPGDTIIIDSSDVVVIDTNFQQKKQGFMYRLWREDYPNPKKALWMSFVVPGSGQMYNKRWWKLPIVYGGLGFTAYLIGFNQKQYKIFRDAYIAELNDQIHIYSGILDSGDLKFLRDGYDQRRQWSWIGFFAVYLFQGAEAFVDAHLRTFDVSDDLSLKVKPTIQQDPFSSPNLGLGIVIHLK